MHLARDDADLTRCREPDGGRRYEAQSDADGEAGRVAAGNVVERAGDPRAGGAAGDRRQHHAAENAAEVLALEDFRDYRAEDGGEAVAERALGEHHQVDQRQRRMILQNDQRRIAGGESERADGPDRKSTRLNSSHGYISYAVFCLKKKKKY